jgi:hypothetical protein
VDNFFKKILKKIWKVLKVAVTLWCQRKGQAPDENGGEIKGRLLFIFLLIFLVKKPRQKYGKLVGVYS